MESSNLTFIENPPVNPMQLFATWHDEAKKFIDPKLFTDTMTIAELNEVDELLNRNVILRNYDLGGLVFVTERNTQKYKDFQKNPKVAVVFLWIYMVNDTLISRQICMTGLVTELPDAVIKEYYKQEPLFAKIRSKICRCGERVDWHKLKTKHDEVLKDYLDGKETLPQTDTYTAIRIIPQKIDFYSGGKNEIADRVKYTIRDGKWERYHVAA